MTHNLRHRKYEPPHENKKLRSQQVVLDKVTANLLENLDNNIFQHNHLKLFISGVWKERDFDERKCRNEMLEIQSSLKSLRKKSFILDLDEQLMENFLFDLADGITSLKDTNLKKTDSLEKQEECYRADLEALDKRMIELSEVDKSKILPFKSRIPIKRNSLIFPKKQHQEVELFDKYLLRTGGHSGGWDDDDHILFLRHRVKLKGQSLADSLHAVLPDLPLEVILEHELWYKEYERLKLKQKDVIKAWRESQKKTSLPAMEMKDHQLPLKTVANPEIVEKKKQQVKEWKMQKMEEQLTIERNIQGAKVKSVELLERRRKEQEQQRQSILLYKERKRQEEEAKRSFIEGQKLRVPVADSKLIMMFQERDRRCEEGSRIKSARAVIKRKPKVTVDRDPGRLLKPTAVWLNRMKKREETDAKVPTADLMHLQNLPRLKVPAWRQVVS